MSPEEDPQNRVNESEEQLNDRQKTLFIGEWFCTCGNCNGNADMDESTHDTTPDDGGSGCGITWEFASSDELPPDIVRSIRPDLGWRTPERQDIGISRQTENQVLGEMKVFGPHRLEDISGRDN